MAEKTLKTRIIQKHDTEANWLLATNFTPMNGEIIIYDEDDNYNYKRIKVGNGTDNVNNLDFYAGDWNDLKNKPKYKEETLRTIFQETDIEINEDLFTEIGDINLKENETYFITLNDITYTCKAWKDKDTNWLCVGNGIFNEQENGDNVPFLLDYHGYFVVAESGIYKLKIETFKNYIVTSEQEITVPERIQTLSNFNLLNFIQLKDLIRIKGSDFDENGYYYFNNNEIPEYIGFYEYKLSTSNPWSEEIGVQIEVEGNHHQSRAPIIFKDFSLDQNCIRALRKDVVIPEEIDIIPGKIQWKYSISPSLYVGITLEELEDGTKIAYFWKTFNEILEAERLGQTIQFGDNEKYYSIMEINTSYLKLQSIKDNKIVTIDWNSNEEYGYVTEKNLSSSWNDLKDKPFHKEVVNAVVFEEQTFEGFTVMEDPLYALPWPPLPLPPVADFIEGDTYKVIWDGVEYEFNCTFDSNSGLLYVGNVNYVNKIPGGDIPFCIAIAPESIFFVTESTESSHTISITHIKSIDKLNLESLPEHNHSWNDLEDKPFGEINNETILSECQATALGDDWSSDNNGIFLYKTNFDLPSAEYIYGQDYIITINGVEYTVSPTYQYQNMDGVYYVGFNIDNTKNVINTANYIPGSEFCLYSTVGQEPTDGSTWNGTMECYLPSDIELPVTIKVSQKEHLLKQIDPKFIPDEIKLFDVVEDEKIILEETVIEQLFEQSGGYVGEVPAIDLSIGQMYKVIFNDITYETLCRNFTAEVNEISILGNGRKLSVLFGMSEDEFEQNLEEMINQGMDISMFDDTGEPFVLVYANNQGMIVTNNQGPHKIKISGLTKLIAGQYIELFQPDWDVNDTTSVTHIKNKPFYITDEIYKTVVFDGEVNLNRQLNDVNTLTKHRHLYHTAKDYSIPFVMARGDVYDVVWDGIEYNNMVIPANPYANVVLGWDWYDTYNQEDLKYPFRITNTEISISGQKSASTHTLKLIKHNNVIVSLDRKFLPGHNHDYTWNDLENKPFGEITNWSLFYRGVHDAIAQEEGYYNIHIDKGLNYDQITEGQKFKIVFNGKPYVTTIKKITYPYSSDGYTTTKHFSGNMACLKTCLELNGYDLSTVDFDFTDTGEPFVYSSEGWFYLMEPAKNVEIIIYTGGEESVKQLDEKFIPDTIARVSDLEKIDLTSYQTINDDTLETTDKTVVGAINELNENAKIYPLNWTNYEGNTKDVQLYNALEDLALNKLGLLVASESNTTNESGYFSITLQGNTLFRIKDSNNVMIQFDRNYPIAVRRHVSSGNIRPAYYLYGYGIYGSANLNYNIDGTYVCTLPLNTKVNKSQGTSKSGQYLVVGEDGNVTTKVLPSYETTANAQSKLDEAKTYADSAATQVKNDLLNGAGAAYDTLKELGDLIDVNVDAIEALETVAANKADKEHTHDQYLTEHQDISGKADKSELFSKSYNDLTNKPTLGSLAAKNTVVKSDLDSSIQTSLNKADTALQSFTETDPTVPAWAKEATKPTYTASEVGAEPAGAANDALEAAKAYAAEKTHTHYVKDITDFKATMNQYATNIYVDSQIANMASGLGGIPQYVYKGADMVANKVIANRNHASLVIGAMTDLHTSGEDDSATSVKHACFAMNEINKNTQLDLVAVLGDVMVDHMDSVNNPGFKYVKQQLDPIVKAVPFVQLEGNHDLDEVNTSADVRRQEYYAYIGANNVDVVTDFGNEFRNYGYKDFNNKRIRVVYLNTSDVAEEGMTTHLRISDEQFNWFINKALNFSNKEGASDWQVVVLTHIPLNYTNKYLQALLQLLKDYKDKRNGSISPSGTAISYDFRNNAQTFLCHIHGHIHNFRTEWFDNVLSITVPNACFGRNNEYGTSSSYDDTVHELYGDVDKDGNQRVYAKTMATVEDTAFSVFVIDGRINNKVHVYNYGAGIHRIIDLVDKSIVEEEINHYEGEGLTPNGDFVNAIPTSTTIGSTTVYNGKGYKNDTYVSSSGGVDSSSVGYVATGVMDYPVNDVYAHEFYILGADLDVTDSKVRIGLFTADGTVRAVLSGESAITGKFKVTQLGDQYYKVEPLYNTSGTPMIYASYGSGDGQTIAGMRLSLKGIGQNLFVSMKNPIVAGLDGETVNWSAYTNVVPSSIDTKGEVFNGVGYKEGTRLNSSGAEAALARAICSGFIPYNNEDIRAYGARVENLEAGAFYVCFYNAAFEKIGVIPGREFSGSNPGLTSEMVDEKMMLTIDVSEVTNETFKGYMNDATYMRVSMSSCSGQVFVVTLNEKLILD